MGLNSVVKGRYPNNVTLAGSPSKILKRNVAWERPNVGRTTPWLRTHGDQIHKTEIYWNKTDDYKEKINLGSGHNELVNLLKKYCLIVIGIVVFEEQECFDATTILNILIIFNLK